MSCPCGDIVCPCGVPCQCSESSCDCTNCSISVSRRCKLCHLPFGAENKVNVCSCFLGDSQISKPKLICDEFQRNLANAVMDGLDESPYFVWVPFCGTQNSFQAGNPTTMCDSQFPPFANSMNLENYSNFNYFDNPGYVYSPGIWGYSHGEMTFSPFARSPFDELPATETFGSQNNSISNSSCLQHSEINSVPSRQKSTETAKYGVKYSSELEAINELPLHQNSPAVTSVQNVFANAQVGETENTNRVSNLNRDRNESENPQLSNSLESVTTEVKCSSNPVQKNLYVSTKQKYAEGAKSGSEEDEIDEVEKIRLKFKENVLSCLSDRRGKILSNTSICRSKLQKQELKESEITKENSSDDWLKLIQKCVQKLQQSNTNQISGT